MLALLVVGGGRGAAAASRRLVRCPRGRLVFPQRGPGRGQREGASARPARRRGERGRRLPVLPAGVLPWPRRAAPLVVAPGGSEWRRQPPRGPRGAVRRSRLRPRRWAPWSLPTAPGACGGKGRFLLPTPRLGVLRRDLALNILCRSLPGNAGRLRSWHLLGISQR